MLLAAIVSCLPALFHLSRTKKYLSKFQDTISWVIFLAELCLQGEKVLLPSRRSN